MAESDTTFVTVFCTGQLMKCDMAVNALKNGGISHQVWAETATGLRSAMSLTSTQGPGRFFCLLVPANAEVEAKRVLSVLPFEITTNPGNWDFQPRPIVMRWWKVCIMGLLTLLVSCLILEFLGWLK